ncbi:DUF3429 domain-containing protein [Gluconobacter sp. LMG 1744]|uniref:DUF3429 domain-containing protein n=2 Tax=Acetobacteraceae TaxID=433 RepID=A0ABR9YYP4_9PROT|nr:DUF3429 domain-containing protein [Gluconobacter cadivus]MBS1053923.1 DUF3429 domain-containing protein [Gluconobacter kondonii]MBS1060680.1 DUF3429 domain-containing protein [Gluconobacter sp. Dm-44]MBS1090688.1 DUF3429 domain-containing protein [Gluconobacter sp. Dm-74]MBF0892128.1 DUF3429 domain-containing protein [Gluconobacter cadivus]
MEQLFQVSKSRREVNDDMRLPFPIFVLGIAGLIPFMTLGGWIFLAGLFTPLPHLKIILLAYGACILSFLGAVHWGLAMERPDIITVGGTSQQDRQRLVLGVCPALWAWLALCIGVLGHVRAGFGLEIIGFVGTFLVEREAWRKGALPPGYLPLRAGLTAIAVLSLFLAALAPSGS